MKYTPQHGKVTVTLIQNNEDARIIIEDTGIGIPEEAMEHLFEEFYRAPNAREFEREGTGLGLTIVKDLVTPGGLGFCSQFTKCGNTIHSKSSIGVRHISSRHDQKKSIRLRYQSLIIEIKTCSKNSTPQGEGRGKVKVLRNATVSKSKGTARKPAAPLGG